LAFRYLKRYLEVLVSEIGAALNSKPHAGFRSTIGNVERVMGIEPTLAAWEAAVLPLNYTRVRGVLYVVV
jgi:hypothetical protein